MSSGPDVPGGGDRECPAITRRRWLRAMAAVPLAWVGAPRGASQPRQWDEVIARARGQRVYFNAWAGDERTNSFIAWVGEQMRSRHGIDLVHVKLKDTAEAVARVVAEKAAGRLDGGSVDLMWINGPNFLAMKEQGLLFCPVAQALPNFRLVDTAGKPSTTIDFTVPVDGYAVPWRMAQIVYVYDSARVRTPPRSIAAMLEWAASAPGRLAHPTARNFLGATFLKQALYELTPDPGLLQRPATDESYPRAIAPLWQWYDRIRPLLWRHGSQFPASGPATRQLMNDGEIDLTISFNPSEASTSIANGELPPTVRTYVLDRGTIGNTSFVAIPFNASHQDAAMVVADFLLAPEAQARMQDARHLGSFSVLDVHRLDADGRRRFEEISRGAATLTSEQLGKPLLEPHPSWMARIVADWERRYVR